MKLVQLFKHSEHPENHFLISKGIYGGRGLRIDHNPTVFINDATLATEYICWDIFEPVEKGYATTRNI